tara:strand:+ start:1280 stop:1384 length:105 start_codon:yes stop_codon:yes gene_type:complete
MKGNISKIIVGVFIDAKYNGKIELTSLLLKNSIS